MKHLMIDLETMGIKPNAPIVSIGAVFFNPATGDMGRAFYRAVSLKSSVEGGAVPDPETILCWMKQSEEARAAICDDFSAVSISVALLDLSRFISDHTMKVQVWGNGATFDNVILRASYERHFLPCPWPFYSDRDVRTIVELGRAIGFDPKKDMPFDGEKHNALADAKHQAKYVSAIWQKLIPNKQND